MRSLENRKSHTVVRESEFRVVVRNGRHFMETVGLPRQIELEGLRDKFRIKPWTDRRTRSILEASAREAVNSLKHVKIAS